MHDKEHKGALGIRFIKDFDVGDLVTWKELANSNKKCGIIKELYTKIKGTRPVAYARVFLIGDDASCDDEVLIIRLKLLSKHGKDD
jgi:uncharacterized protein YijF (DUF1287 family)